MHSRCGSILTRNISGSTHTVRTEAKARALLLYGRKTRKLYFVPRHHAMMSCRHWMHVDGHCETNYLSPDHLKSSCDVETVLWSHVPRSDLAEWLIAYKYIYSYIYVYAQIWP